MDTLYLSAPALAERLHQITGALRHAIALRGGRNHAVIPLVVLLWSYLGRAAARFDALAVRLAAGRVTKPRRSRRDQPPAHDPGPPQDPRPRKPRVPGGHLWLFRLLPATAAGHGSQLRHLLCEPEMAAFLGASPQAGRLLRPLCRLLGIKPAPDLPPALFPPRRAAPSSPARKAAAGASPARRTAARQVPARQSAAQQTPARTRSGPTSRVERSPPSGKPRFDSTSGHWATDYVPSARWSFLT